MNENEKDRWYILGQIAGMEMIAKELIDKACEQLRRNEINKSLFLRSLSEELSGNATKARAEYDKKWPKKSIPPAPPG